MTTATGGGWDDTVIVAEADFVGSALLVAVTEYVPAVAGAVYSPEEETVPDVADQLTDVLLVPVRVAVNCCVALTWIAATGGLMETATGAVTVTVADAVFVVSATLRAVTV
jgi:hypothetical protein